MLKHRLQRTIAMVGLFWLSGTASALDISGSSTIQPIVARLIPLYDTAGGEPVKLVSGGSGAGIADVLSGKSQIGMVSRALKDDEQRVLKHLEFGIDALAIIVNQRNPLTNLTKNQLIDLYTGKIKNWQDLGGPDETVVLVSKEVGRSTLELFEHYTGLVSADRQEADNRPKISPQAMVIGSNLECLTLVGGLNGAIGYVSAGTAQSLIRAGMPVRILRLDGIEPTEETIRRKIYPIIRPLNLVYTQESPPIQAFLDLALDAQGQSIVRSLGFIPVR